MKRAATRMGSISALARRLGSSRAYVSRLSRGEQDPSIESTLRIASVNEDDPIEALEEAGHKRVAAVLRAYYGKDAKITAEQRGILDDLAAMGDADRERILGLIRSLARRKRSTKR